MRSNRIYKNVTQGVPQMSPKMSPNNTFYTDMTNI